MSDPVDVPVSAEEVPEPGYWMAPAMLLHHRVWELLERVRMAVLMITAAGALVYAGARLERYAMAHPAEVRSFVDRFKPAPDQAADQGEAS